MANYYGSARSNYFRVKDLEKFKEALPAGVDVWDRAGDDRVAVYSSCPDSGSWPTWSWDSDTDSDFEVDVVEIVSKHLADHEVAVFMEAGAEKLRYIVGYAEAVNSKGERVQVMLNDIYNLANDLTDYPERITQAEY